MQNDINTIFDLVAKNKVDRITIEQLSENNDLKEFVEIYIMKGERKVSFCVSIYDFSFGRIEAETYLIDKIRQALFI